MNRRLQQFLSAENISQSQFAETLGVARANISHILSGRNKPGFDFIEKLLRAYPALNLDWLVTGKGKMYKSIGQPVKEEQTPPSSSSELFDNEEDGLSIEAFENQDDALIFQSAMNYPEPAAPQSSSKQSSFKTSSVTSRNDRQTSTNKKIVKVLVFYSDNTYQELK